jgi:hypothetical protein
LFQRRDVNVLSRWNWRGAGFAVWSISVTALIIRSKLDTWSLPMDMTELALRQQLRDSMDDEIAKRTKKHQAQIASIRTAEANRLAAGAVPPNTPLVMLAHGDSWFDYPLSGNSISLTSEGANKSWCSPTGVRPVRVRP